MTARAAGGANRDPGLDARLAGRRVGVCLSSGFFGFFAHLGFVRALARLGVEPGALSGCSAGALVAALLASGLEPARIREILVSIRPSDLFDPPGLRQLVRGPFGLIAGARLERELDGLLPVRSFEACPVPLTVSTFDLGARRLRYLQSGPLAPAVRASLSLPGMFCPAPVDGHLLWDGGAVEKVPVLPLARRPEVETILVCHLSSGRGRGQPSSLLGGLRAALDSHVVAAARRDLAEARSGGREVLVVAPRVPRCGPHRLRLGPAIVERAEDETLRIVRQADFGCPELA